MTQTLLCLHMCKATYGNRFKCDKDFAAEDTKDWRTDWEWFWGIECHSTWWIEKQFVVTF